MSLGAAKNAEHLASSKQPHFLEKTQAFFPILSMASNFRVLQKEPVPKHLRKSDVLAHAMSCKTGQKMRRNCK